MAKLTRVVAALRKQERRLAAELARIRSAIALLEFGSAGVPRPAIIETPHAARARKRKSRPRRRR